MTSAQRQHWEYQQRRAEALARIYGAGDKVVREMRLQAAERLSKERRRGKP